MPLGQWLDRWLEEYAAPSVRPSTLEGYRGYIERNIKPHLGDKPVRPVCPLQGFLTPNTATRSKPNPLERAACKPSG